MSDLNGDGYLDLVSANTFAGSGVAVVSLNRGDGTFGAGVSYSAGINFLNNLSTADVNGDGVMDILTAGDNGSSSNPTFGVRLGRGDGTFDPLFTYAIAGSGYSFSVTSGDITNDGVADVMLAFQGGGTSKTMTLYGNTVAGTSPIQPFSLQTMAGARQALAPLARKISQIAEQRGSIGAYQGRLSSAIATQSVTVENYAAAASQITDTDVAEESANLTRLNILQQAASAVLAQANQQPAIALKLLKRI